MAQKTIHRKHFLVSAGVALAGFVSLRRLTSKSTPDPLESGVAGASASERVQREPRAVSRSVETV